MLGPILALRGDGLGAPPGADMVLKVSFQLRVDLVKRSIYSSNDKQRSKGDDGRERRGCLDLLQSQGHSCADHVHYFTSARVMIW